MVGGVEEVYQYGTYVKKAAKAVAYQARLLNSARSSPRRFTVCALKGATTISFSVTESTGIKAMSSHLGGRLSEDMFMQWHSARPPTLKNIPCRHTVRPLARQAAFLVINRSRSSWEDKRSIEIRVRLRCRRAEFRKAPNCTQSCDE